MPRNAYFWNKNVKITSASGDPPPNLRLPPRLPRYYSYLLLQVCRVHFSR